MTKNRYLQLKDLLRGPDLAAAQTHFFDYFAEAPDFLERSLLLQSSDETAILEAATRAAIKHVTGEAGSGCRLLKLEEYGIVHGGFTHKGRLGSVFYCEKIRTGLVCLTSGFSGRSDFVRFRTTLVGHGPGAN